VREMNDAERGALKVLSAAGTRMVITGQNATGLAAGPNVTLMPNCPCRRYEQSLDDNMDKAEPSQAREFLDALRHQGEIEITASPRLATSIAMVDGKPHIFFANFDGLIAGKNPIPSPQTGITLRTRTRATVRFLPFLGNVQEIRGTADGDHYLYRLPQLTRGGVAWVEK
jgi:hypothetical protein